MSLTTHQLAVKGKGWVRIWIWRLWMAGGRRRRRRRGLITTCVVVGGGLDEVKRRNDEGPQKLKYLFPPF